MKKISNTNKKKYVKKRVKESGFTLIELLATIAILSLVSVIVMYTAVNVIGTAKDKSYNVSVSNIEKEAGTYVIERQADLSWQNIDGDFSKQYYCVSVQNLIDTGYFDSDILESEISSGKLVDPDYYVYLERDTETKTVTKNVLLADDRNLYSNLCDSMKLGGSISYEISPSGWSSSKNVLVKYQLKNYSSDFSEYRYYYNYEYDVKYIDGTEPFIYKESVFSTKTYSENITITKNGTLQLKILHDGDTSDLASKSLNITKIDNTKPQISVSISDGTIYTKNKDAVIKLVDNESGFKVGNYKVYYGWSTSDMSCSDLKNSKFVNLTVGSSNAKESSSATINIINETGAGKLYVCGEGITDYVGNPVKDLVVSSDMYLDNTRPVITLGTYTSGEVKETVTIPIKVTDSHSGVDSTSFVSSDVTVKVDNVALTSGVTITREDDNNYNLTIENKTKHGAVTISIGENKVLDKATNGNEAVEFTTGIVFNNTYMINYDSNGGTGTMDSTECTYGESCTLRNNSFTKVGYTFVGWSKDSDATNATYENGDTISTFNETNDITLYAVWKINKVIIRYNVNGGTIKTSTVDGSTTYTWSTDSNGIIKRKVNSGTSSILEQKIDYGSSTSSSGLANYNNSKYISISKTGYSGPDGAEWKCLSGCSTSNKTYDHDSVYNASDFCDASYGDCTVVVGVNWKDLTGPTITLGTNGNSSYAQSVSSSISVSDSGSGVDSTTYKYIYSTSDTATPTTTFTSGSSYSLNDRTGIYYLIAYACDKVGNCTTKKSNEFHLDNTAPDCSLSVTTSGITFASRTDNVGVTSSWLSTSSSATSGSTSLSLSIGTKYGFVKDQAGNTGRCSVELTDTAKKYTCSKSAIKYSYPSCSSSNYNNPSSACAYYYSSNNCSVSHTYSVTYTPCSRTVSSYSGTCKCRLSGNFTWNTFSCTASTCSATCLAKGFDTPEGSCTTNYRYYFSSGSTVPGASSCTASSFTCNETNYGENKVSCEITNTTYSGSITCYSYYCNSNEGKYDGGNCYLYSQNSCSSGWTSTLSSATCGSDYEKLNNTYCYK